MKKIKYILFTIICLFGFILMPKAFTRTTDFNFNSMYYSTCNWNIGIGSGAGHDFINNCVSNSSTLAGTVKKTYNIANGGFYFSGFNIDFSTWLANKLKTNTKYAVQFDMVLSGLDSENVFNLTPYIDAGMNAVCTTCNNLVISKYDINKKNDHTYTFNLEFTSNTDNLQYITIRFTGPLSSTAIYNSSQYDGYYSTKDLTYQLLRFAFYYEESELSQNSTIIDQNTQAETTRKGILDTVKSIVTGITNLPNLIWNAIKGGFENITNFLDTFLYWFDVIFKKIADLPNLISNALKGFFENITKGLTDTLNFIKTLPGLIWNAIKGGFEAITNALVTLGNFIIDGLKSLFIPENDFFSNYFQEIYNFFTNKLGILMYPLELLINVLNRFINLNDSTNGLIHIPSISIGNFGELIGEREFYINEHWNEQPYLTIYNVYKTFVNAFVGVCLIKLAMKKKEEIVGGGSA